MCDGVDWPDASGSFNQSVGKSTAADSLMKNTWLSDFVRGGLVVVGGLFP